MVRVVAKKIYHYSLCDDRCDSQYECNVVNNLIERGIRYEFHPEDKFAYEYPIQGGACEICGSTNVLQNRVYGPDLILRDSGLAVEIKGKWAGRGYPHKRNLMTYVMRKYPYKIAWLFLSNASIGHGSKTRNEEWAMKNRAFATAIGIHIPDEWNNPEWVAEDSRRRNDG